MKNAAKSRAPAPAKGQKRKRATADVAHSMPVGVAVSQDVVPAPAVAVQQDASVLVAAAPTLPTVSIASSCTVKDAMSLKQSLDAFASTEGQIIIDASAVERVDTSIVQLLCAFTRVRLAGDREVLWHAPSAAFLEAARLLGVHELLSLPRTNPTEAGV